MYFNHIEIENYKCFKDKVSLKLEQGINVIVGKNNIGKTALLEALSLQFPDKPYYSVSTYPTEDQKPLTHSKVTITFTVEIEELIRLLLIANGRGNVNFRMPVDLKYKLTNKDNDKFDQSFQDAKGKTHGKEFFSNQKFVFKLQREAHSENGGKWIVLDDSYVFPSLNRFEENDGVTQYYVEFEINRENRSFDFRKTSAVSGGSRKHREDFIGRVANEICEIAVNYGRYIYIFQATRVPQGTCSLADNRKLESDSSNLAEVLHYYLSNPTQASKFNRLVRQIIPNINQVASVSFNDQESPKAKIVVWNNKSASGHNHLAFSLKDVGSGVGQILAILYILLTAEDPQIILIDEPQSFLHPDASRKLIDVLRNYGNNHQIIIATHSPTIITSAEPRTVTLIKQTKSKSVLHKIDIEKVENQRIYLSEIGAKLSDVFGYDRIIWVEGITEEICFPKIIRILSKKPLLGTAILQVHSTGEFDQADAKNVNIIVDIYERLSSTDGGLVPDAVGYIFDKETRTDDEIKEKKKKYPNIYFTKKRLYENYLLNSNAIFNVINQIETKSQVKLKDIEKWIEEKKEIKKYYQPFNVPKNLDTWTNSIHGKRFLKDLFKEFCTSSENQNYKERVHSVRLTEWLLENSKNELREIAELIEKAMKS